MDVRGAALLGLALVVASPERETPERPRSGFPPAPLHFEANRGQTNPAVRFLARPRGYRAWFTDEETVFLLPRGTGKIHDPLDPAPPLRARGSVVRMRIEGMGPAPRLTGAMPLPGRSHYFIGDDPAKWVTGAEHCGGIEARDPRSGAGLRWHGTDRGLLEYDLRVAPGTDPDGIAMSFTGAASMALDGNGDLLLRTEAGVLRHSRPVAWQEDGARRSPVMVRFALRDGGRVGFETGRYDRSRALVIDPVLGFSSCLGGAGTEQVLAVAAAADGSTFLAGLTTSTDFPAVSAYKSTTSGGYSDIFVSKVAPDGSGLVYSTYLGGSDADYGEALAVGADGAAYVTGHIASTNFPVVNALQATNLSSDASAFLTKVAPSGAALAYSTYLGGNYQGGGLAVLVDPAGAAIVTGFTAATNFPTASPIQPAIAGSVDAFVTKFNPAGNTLAWSTYLGGNGGDYGYGIARDSAGAVYVAGFTNSTDFPVTGPYQSTLRGTRDAFLTKIAPDGASRVYSTLFGGNGQETTRGVAVDSTGAAWVVGSTSSTDLPLQYPIQSANAGLLDAFVTKFSPQGNSLAASTYLGGAANEQAYAVAVGPKDIAYVAGMTESDGFPVVKALYPTRQGAADGFVCGIPAAGASLLWSTYLGGSDNDYAVAVALDGTRSVVVGGSTSSSNFPRVGGFQAGKNGFQDGFVASLRVSPLPPADCEASLTGLTQVGVTWSDMSPDETGFTVERSVDGGPFTTRATLGPGTTAYTDPLLAPSTTYAYRVRSFSDEGISDPTNEDDAITPASPTYPPAAPSNLQGTVASPRRVDLSWSDNSDDEDFFSLARATGPALFSTLATPNLGKTSYADLTVLPERTYSWKIRAQNPLGFSLFSNTVTVTMPPTVAVAVTKGKIADKAAIRKDAVTLAGTLAYGADAEHAAFDPSNQSFTLRLGTMDDPPLLSIPVPADGWTLKKGKYAWKSPKGSSVKAKVTVDAATSAWTVKLTGLTLTAPAASPLRTTLTVGTDTGHHEADWTAPSKSGVVKYPVPVPK